MAFYNEAIETLPRDELRTLQSERLCVLLEQICGRNQFYSARMESAGLTSADVTTVGDLSKLPFTTKSDLIDAQTVAESFGTNATYEEAAYTRVHQTSGTTGTPLRVVDTPESWDWWGRCWGYVLAGAGLTADDRLFVPFSFGPFIGFWAAVEGAKEIGALMIPGGGRDSLQRINLIAEMSATAICCTPTYALRLAEVAREANIDLPEMPVRVTVHAGEPGANIPATKARLQQAWGARCFDHAGASEVGAHSFECEAQPGGTHLIESEFIAEVIDFESEEPTPAGEIGELVITNLGRASFPVLRYRTGDLVRANTNRCECGLTFMRFDGGVLGRADDMVVVRGVNVFPSALENLLRQVDAIVEYKVVVSQNNTMRELYLELELKPQSDADEAVENVGQSVQNSLGLRPIVKVVSAGSLPRFELKAKRFHVEK